MKKLVLLLPLLALAALAGTRAAESAGNVPTLATEGVSLTNVEGCRLSARSADGGTVNGGKVVAYYYDAVNGWTRSASTLDCTLESNKLLDGGAPRSQVCSDLAVGGSFGRIAAVNGGVTSADGGTPVGLVVRVECYGKELP